MIAKPSLEFGTYSNILQYASGQFKITKWKTPNGNKGECCLDRYNIDQIVYEIMWMIQSSLKFCKNPGKSVDTTLVPHNYSIRNKLWEHAQPL